MPLTVAFEGVNRCGKSTQLRLAERALHAQGYHVITMKFPTRETPIGAVIYDHFEGRQHLDALTLQYLLEANKVEWQAVLRQWQADPRIDYILIDRYLLSGSVYGKARGLSESQIQDLQRALIHPDMTLIYDIDINQAMRRSQAVLERDEQNRALMEAVRHAYLQEAQSDPSVRVIDATGGPEQVLELTMAHLTPLTNFIPAQRATQVARPFFPNDPI